VISHWYSHQGVGIKGQHASHQMDKEKMKPGLDQCFVYPLAL